MGVGDIFRRVQGNLEFEAGSQITKKIENEVSKKTCPKCGKAIQPGLKFCANCGAKLTVTCQTCNKDFPLGTKFCPQCGKAIK